MSVFTAEIARIGRTGWVWVFLALCVVSNLVPLITAPSDPAYEAAVAATAGQGTRIDAALLERLPAVTAPQRAVRADLGALDDVFATTDYSAIGRTYIAALDAEGATAEALQQKYALAAEVAAVRVQDGAGKSLYLAAQTSAAHSTAFRAVLPAVTIESLLLATLLVLHVIGIEQTRGTAPMLYSSRIGRRLALTKALAASIAALTGVLLLTAAAWAALLAKYPFAAVASADVESGFNLIEDPLVGLRPFLTWYPMTIAGYAIATLVVTLALTLVFAVTAAAITAIIREPYFAFAVLLLANGLVFAGPLLIPLRPLAFLSVLTPVWLWLKQSSWFTDAGFDVLWPHFETLGVTAATAVAIALGVVAHHYFRRKDLA